jgi:hypothetical protein
MTLSMPPGACSRRRRAHWVEPRVRRTAKFGRKRRGDGRVKPGQGRGRLREFGDPRFEPVKVALPTALLGDRAVRRTMIAWPRRSASNASARLHRSSIANSATRRAPAGCAADRYHVGVAKGIEPLPNGPLQPLAARRAVRSIAPITVRYSAGGNSCPMPSINMRSAFGIETAVSLPQAGRMSGSSAP